MRLLIVGGDKRERRLVERYFDLARVFHWEQHGRSRNSSNDLPNGTTHVVVWANHCRHTMHSQAVAFAQKREGVPFFVARSMPELLQWIEREGGKLKMDRRAGQPFLWIERKDHPRHADAKESERLAIEAATQSKQRVKVGEPAPHPAPHSPRVIKAKRGELAAATNIIMDDVDREWAGGFETIKSLAEELEPRFRALGIESTLDSIRSSIGAWLNSHPMGVSKVAASDDETPPPTNGKAIRVVDDAMGELRAALDMAREQHTLVESRLQQIVPDLGQAGELERVRASLADTKRRLEDVAREALAERRRADEAEDKLAKMRSMLAG